MSRAVKIAAWLVKSLRKRLFSALMICSAAWEMFAVFDPAGAHQSPSRIQLIQFSAALEELLSWKYSSLQRMVNNW